MGVIAASGEFRHSIATLTYRASPCRSRVLCAKAIAAALVGAIFGLIGTAIAAGIGLVATARAGQPITLSTATLLRDDLGTIVGATLLTPPGVAKGSLIRSHVAGIVAVTLGPLRHAPTTRIRPSSVAAAYLPVSRPVPI
jgi:hypothetical protein